jgi:hypothetical protein
MEVFRNPLKIPSKSEVKKMHNTASEDFIFIAPHAHKIP